MLAGVHSLCGRSLGLDNWAFNCQAALLATQLDVPVLMNLIPSVACGPAPHIECAYPLPHLYQVLTRYSVEEVTACIAGLAPMASGGSGDVFRAFLRGAPVAVKRMTCVGDSNLFCC